jgi:RNA polymerase sigma-70 factor (ECF subfamily)
MELHAFDNAYLMRLRASDGAVGQHFASYFRRLLVIKLRARRLEPSVIDDICQETFLRVLAAVRRDRGDEDGIRRVECLGAFVNSVCNHVLQEEYRQSVRSGSLEAADVPEIPDQAIDPDGLLVSLETSETVRRVLAQLPEKDRALLRAIFLEEKDKDDVCREFGVDREYLRVLLHRAKARFRCRYRGHRAVVRRRGQVTAVPQNQMRNSQFN